MKSKITPQLLLDAADSAENAAYDLNTRMFDDTIEVLKSAAETVSGSPMGCPRRRARRRAGRTER